MPSCVYSISLKLIEPSAVFFTVSITLPWASFSWKLNWSASSVRPFRVLFAPNCTLPSALYSFVNVMPFSGIPEVTTSNVPSPLSVTVTVIVYTVVS